MSNKNKILQCRADNPTFGYDTISKVLNLPLKTVQYWLVTKTSLKDKLTKLKNDFGGKCKICSYSKCLSALEFHHLNPKTKKGQVRDVLLRNGLDAAIKEAKKCVLICSNCHRETHAGLLVL